MALIILPIKLPHYLPPLLHSAQQQKLPSCFPISTSLVSDLITNSVWSTAFIISAVQDLPLAPSFSTFPASAPLSSCSPKCTQYSFSSNLFTLDLVCQTSKQQKESEKQPLLLPAQKQNVKLPWTCRHLVFFSTAHYQKIISVFIPVLLGIFLSTEVSK